MSLDWGIEMLAMHRHHIIRAVAALFGIALVVIPSASAQAYVPGSVSAILRSDGGSTGYLRADAVAAGWHRGTIKVTYELFYEDIVATKQTRTCSSSTSCNAPNYDVPCPRPGRWYLNAWASGPGGSDYQGKNILIK